MATFVLRELRLRQYRNFAELELQFPPEGVAIIGENGSGKTNLLEAIGYLEIFRSFRGAPDEQLVRFGADAFHLRGRLGDSGSTREIAAAFESSRGKRKRVTIDGVEPDRIGDALGQLGAIIFSPSDVEIIRGSPAERRRFLDIVLSLNRPGYLVAVQRYRHVLRQRNAALRDPRGYPIEAWNSALVEAGSRIIADRMMWVSEYAAEFAAHYSRISGTALQGLMRYTPGLGRSSVETVDPAAIAAAFESELQRVAQRERDRGMTLVGPHRDDLAFEMNNGTGPVDLRSYGSGGQVRTAAIALRLVEAETARTQRRLDPVILLDDVFAELDRPRSERIFELIDAQRPGQVILTAPKESDVMFGHAGLPRWHIAGGYVES